MFFFSFLDPCPFSMGVVVLRPSSPWSSGQKDDFVFFYWSLSLPISSDCSCQNAKLNLVQYVGPPISFINGLWVNYGQDWHMWKVDCIHMLIFNCVCVGGGGGSVPLTRCARVNCTIFFCHILIFLQSLTALVHVLSLQVVVYFVQSLEVLSAGGGQSVGVLPCQGLVLMVLSSSRPSTRYSACRRQEILNEWAVQQTNCFSLFPLSFHSARPLWIQWPLFIFQCLLKRIRWDWWLIFLLTLPQAVEGAHPVNDFISKIGVSSAFMSLVSDTQTLAWGSSTRIPLAAHLPK